MTITFYEVEDKVTKDKPKQESFHHMEYTDFYEDKTSNVGVDWHTIRIMRRAAERWRI